MTGRALVIGCGGTIGGAWIVAALHALEIELGWDAREADLLQGTSAGAEMVTMLASGVAVSELVAMHRGAARLPTLRAHYHDTPPSLPPLPAPRLLNPRMVAEGGHIGLSGIAPTGRGDASWLARLAGELTDGRDWFDHPAARMVAYDIRARRRVVFGSPAAPTVPPAIALQASWAVPGWMPPVTAGGRTYIDGGAASTASLDLVPPGFDEVYVIAPMASPDGARIPGIGGCVENRLLRRRMTKVLDAEIETARAAGARVITICPTAEDLAGLPPNFMGRRTRRRAFENAMRTAPATVAAALVAAGVPCR